MVSLRSAQSIKKFLPQFAWLSIFAFLMIAINGCDALYWNESSSLEKVRQKPELVVLSISSAQQDHDLIEDFAGTYNLKTRYKYYKSEDEVVAALKNGEGDIAAARLSPPSGSHGFLLGPAYEDTALSLFCHNKLQIANVQDLNSRRVALLRKDQPIDFDRRLIRFAPLIQLEVIDNQSPRELIRAVQERKYDCAIMEKLEGRIASRYAPSVDYTIDLSNKFSLRWLLAPQNYDLRLLMQSWFQQASRNDEIMRIKDRYQTYLDELDKHDLRRLRQSLAFDLKTYKKFFVEAAQQTQLPWQLIAAVAYQESHWNAQAQSFTGVRGFMQLTAETADHLGVTDRNDPEQSIHGGARYLRYLIDKIPSSVNSKDRWALGLAAYNIGYAHLRDAQKLAERLGRNPYSWHHLREILPLLAQDSYASELEYGPARGYETVEFVERVRSFYNYMLK